MIIGLWRERNIGPELGQAIPWDCGQSVGPLMQRIATSGSGWALAQHFEHGVAAKRIAFGMSVCAA